MKVLLIDGYSLFFRAYFALPGLTTRAGVPTSALYGFSSLLVKLFREERPAGAAVALDLPSATFRHQRWDGYKATRPKQLAGTLPQQLERFPELLAAFGFPVFTSPGFEGDDVLATLARELSAAGASPLVVTGDHDALQLARAGTRVYIVSRGKVKDTIWDEPKVRAELGVAPGQVADWIALVGDPSDNLPGIPGIGPKQAAQLLLAHGDMAGILAHLDAVPPRAQVALRAHLAELPLWADLARLRDDVPLREGPRHAPLDEAARGRLRVLFETLEFRSLLGRLEM
jgi:DNA polymerase I